jgi:glycosyltransferase involved in cell wall biosynthesis
MNPLISIITVTYNAENHIEKSILSVLQQKKELYEYIIIDGNSNDSTLDIINKYKKEIDYVVSELDKGIYDAMNKGIRFAKGDWLYFLGSDDQLTENILSTIFRFLETNNAVVYGDVICDGKHKYTSKIGFRCLFENRLHHQSAFYNRNLFYEFKYDDNFLVHADYELTLRIYLRKLKHKYISLNIANFSSGGASTQLSSDEINRIRKKYINNRFVNGFFSTGINLYYAFFKIKMFLLEKINQICKK